MKSKQLILGFVIGIFSGAIICFLLVGRKAMANNSFTNKNKSAANYPDSLDGVIADPENHKVVFENDKVRILEVIGAPYAVEPVHTHRWTSVMWAADSNFAKSKLIYYHCGYDSIKKTFYVKDSILESGPPPNRGFQIPPEGLHRVTSLSDKPITAYRVEFKN